MIRFNLLFLPIVLVTNLNAQIVETTIAPESNRDYNGRRILLNTDDGAYLQVSSGGHRPSPIGVPDNCYSHSNDVKSYIYKVSPQGALLAQEETSKDAIYYDKIHLGDSRYAAFGIFPCEKSWTEASGIGFSHRGYTLIAGVIDTIGANDSSLNFVASFEDLDCDFELGHYFGSAADEHAVYGLYKRTNGYDNCNYLWRIDQTSGNTQKIATQGNFNYAQEKSDHSGFYCLFFEPSAPFVCYLGELHLDGSVTKLSADISFEAEERLPRVLFKNGSIYTVGSKDYSLSSFRKYDLQGTLQVEVVTNYATEKILWTSYGMLAIQTPVERSKSNDSKPMKIRLFDADLNEIGYQEFGFEKLGIHDYDFDSSKGQLTIIGIIHHTGVQDINEQNKKIYFFRAKISDIFPNATAIESLESGRIYPNPSNDSAVFLELKNSDELESDAELVLRFFDVQGKSVNPSYSKAGPALYEINSSELPAGTYLGVVETADGERVFSQLFVVDR